MNADHLYALLMDLENPLPETPKLMLKSADMVHISVSYPP